MDSRFRFSSAVVLVSLLTVACGEPLVLGSDLIWSTDHESGSLDDWAFEQRGGARPGAEPESTVEITSERAHSGSYSAKLTRAAVPGDEGPLLYRELGADRVYASAWYYLTAAPETLTYWTIAQIRAQPGSDPDAAPHGLNFNLRVLPGGQVLLVMLDNDETKLQSPLADPPAFVPLGAWFQIEALFENGGTAAGKVTIWLDGRRVYEIATGALVGGGANSFMPCNVAKDLGTIPVALYVDDVAISLSRVTPDGVLALE